jgi:hypothetical protein
MKAMPVVPVAYKAGNVWHKDGTAKHCLVVKYLIMVYILGSERIRLLLFQAIYVYPV